MPRVGNDAASEFERGRKGGGAMRDTIVVTIDRDDVLAPQSLPADLIQKFAVVERQRPRHWIWTLIASTFLTMLGLVVWLANRI